ncbi:MAG: hypothetical protein ABI367_00485 [Mucilaginibacter sp.]
MKKFLTIVLIALTARVFAQNNLITGINITLPSNPDANTANWINGNSLLLISASTHVVNGRVDLSVEASTLLVTIKKDGTKVCGTYTSNTAPSASFNTITKVWSGNGATTFLGQSCTLSPGNYELSVQFFSYNHSTSKMAAVSDEKTKPFTIVNTTQAYQPPQTLQPVNAALFTTATITQPITFRWTPVIPAPQGVVTYRLKIWQLLLGQTATQAKTLNTPLVNKDVTGVTQTVVTSLISGPPQPPYIADFVWTVQALNAQGQPIGSNTGTSNMNEFSVPTGTIAGLGCATVSTKVFNTGDEIGLSNGYKVKLTAVPTGTNTALTGTGTVSVKWLGLLNVKFKDIKINGDNNLCEGAVYTDTDPNQHYPTQWAVDILNDNSAGSWTINSIKQISGEVKTNKLLKPLVPATNQVNATLAAHPVNMPLGYFKGGDTTTAIGITEMIFRPDYAEFEAIASYNTKGLFKTGGFTGTDAIALSGRGIKFTDAGLSGITGSIKLIQPLTFTYANAGTENLKLTFNIESAGHIGNGIVFSPAANTFWMYNLDVNAQLPKEWLVPVDKTKTNVDMNFQLSIAQFDDFILQGTLPACIIPHTNGVGLESGLIVYDHSSISNASGMVFPAGYGGNTNTFFTGFYLKNFKFTLPDQLRSYADTTKAVQVTAENLIIDQYGISGKVNAYNILNYPKANIGNLGASIDTVNISLANSVLTQASMSGKITLPLSSSDNATRGINYSALFVPSNSATGNASSLTFALHPNLDITSKFLGDGKIQINQTSSLNLILSKSSANVRNIQLSIDLNGKLYYPTGKIIDPGSTIPLDLDLSCDFEHLGMTYNKNAQESFTFDSGHWSFASPQKKLSGFAFTITNVKPKIEVINQTTEKQYLFKGGVELDAKINIGSENSNISISGDTKIALTGAIESSKYTPPATSATGSTNSITNLNVLTAQSQLATSGIQPSTATISSARADYGFLTQLKPIYLGVEVDSINIESHMPAVYIKGSVNFYKHDPVYGNGFKGDLTAKFTTLELAIQAGAIFGNTKYVPANNGIGFKYWMIQAQVNLPPPGIVFLPGVAFRGFGAGVYSRMHMTVPTVFNPTQAAASTFGGAIFTPDMNVSMGFKAKAIIATTPKEETFNGSVALSAQFNTSGGMDFIQFDGIFNCGAKIGEEVKAFANGTVTVKYDFPHKLFDMGAGLNLNNDVIKTVNPIYAHFYIDGLKNEWAFTCGIPDSLNTVRLFNTVNVNEYLMFGNKIPIPNGFMPTTLAGLQNAGITSPFGQSAVSSETKTAKGFALGVGLNFSGSGHEDAFSISCIGGSSLTAGAKWNYNVGGEFDASLLQYDATLCPGLGHTGWRMKTQVAFYASVDVKAYYKRCNGKSGEIDLLSFNGGGYAGAEFPNPFYAEGAIAVKDASILNGLIKFSYHTSFKIGEPCDGGPVAGTNSTVYTQQNEADSLSYSLIRNIITPGGTSEIARTTNFSVLLNYPANEPFDLQEQQASGQIKVRTFRAVYTATLTKDSISNVAQLDPNAAVHNGAYLVNDTGNTIPATTSPALQSNGAVLHAGSFHQTTGNAANHATQHNNNATVASLGVNHVATLFISNDVDLTDGGYDALGAKLYEQAALTGIGTLHPAANALKANTSYKFAITGA